MLGNRVRRTARHLARWARREGVTCYRLYDCDIPEVPLTLDRYEATMGVHYVVAFWEGHSEQTPDWLSAMVEALSAALNANVNDIHVKVRRRQEGRDQYDRLGMRGERAVVFEGGLRFLVNFHDYLDTGLFLDHRPMRAWVGAMSRDKEVLNLFGYTGAFTVHAAAGGARSTMTLDLSQTYLDWARDNLAENGLLGPAHTFIRADLLRWLRDAPEAAWDVIVLDPPTFSNSKKMAATFDVQRDHPALLQATRRLLRPGGTLWFSTNARRFRPDPGSFEECAELAACEEVSARSVPPDFRDRKIHRAWKMTRA